MSYPNRGVVTCQEMEDTIKVGNGQREPPLLEVIALKTYFFGRQGVLRAVDGVSFAVRKGEAFGLVGESGSGKSVTCLSLLRLVPQPAGRIVGGAVLLDGEDLLQKTEREMRRYRGKRIAIIPQDPTTSLNPVFTIGNQLGEAIAIHQRNIQNKSTYRRACEILSLVGIPEPNLQVHSYPHMMSGGMRQRAVSGMAIACQPDVLIADEATTSLDVTVQLQFLDLLQNLQRTQAVSLIFVTHNLGVVAKVCNRAAVMYAGRIVESASVRELFNAPAHPYTIGLLDCLVRPGLRTRRLSAIPGQPPNPINLPPGCRFAPRCPSAKPVCDNHYPPETTVSEDHLVSCWMAAQ